MYIPNKIEEILSEGFDMGRYSTIFTALSRNYGVFHIDCGTDDNGIPFGEIGLTTVYPIQSTFPEMSWESYFEPDHELNEEEADFYKRIGDYYNSKIFPIVTTEITMPDELSTKFISGIEGLPGGVEVEDGQEVVFNVHTYSDSAEIHEVIVRCSFQEEAYKNLKIGSSSIADEDSFMMFIEWYLIKWLSLQPRISTMDHLD